MFSTLPNILTFSRILAIPVVIGLLLFVDDPLGSWLAFAIYTYACITDFFDGYLARAWHLQSAFGRFLDPIADKLLIASILLVLVGIDRISGLTVLPAAVILCREILVSGLREFLAEVRVSVPVTTLAKWKTTIQMLALGFLLVGPSGPDFILLTTTEVGIWGLWGAAALTLVTGYDYLVAGLKHIVETDHAPADKHPDKTGAAHKGAGAGKLKIFGLVGWSGSGKTTLFAKLVPELISRGFRVSTMKHTHHNFDIDKPGKDSYEHRLAGAAEVLITGSSRWALLHENRNAPEPSIDDLLARMEGVDLVLIEGFKSLGHQKMEVHRPSVGKPLLAPDDPSIVAVASDTDLNEVNVPVLPLDDVTAIADFIINYVGLVEAEAEDRAEDAAEDGIKARKKVGAIDGAA